MRFSTFFSESHLEGTSKNRNWVGVVEESVQSQWIDWQHSCQAKTSGWQLANMDKVVNAFVWLAQKFQTCGSKLTNLIFCCFIDVSCIGDIRTFMRNIQENLRRKKAKHSCNPFAFHRYNDVKYALHYMIDFASRLSRFTRIRQMNFWIWIFIFL